MPALTIRINRAPVLTLWIATVAHHEGHDWDTSLTIGYEYLMRNPWYLAANAPKATHDNTIYLNVRYTLPGGAPAVK